MSASNSLSCGLRILQAGPGVTVQDAGRWGYLRFGVAVAGPMDLLAYELAHRIAQLWSAPDRAGAAALEISVGGLDLCVEGRPVCVAICGGAFTIRLDGTLLSGDVAFTAFPGQRISLRAGKNGGSWAYLAVSGSFNLALELGSCATHIRSGVGSLGRGLRAGDLLEIDNARPGPESPRAIANGPGDAGPVRVVLVRVVLGPQDDYFDAAAIAQFLSGPWTIGARSDRMATLLEGPRIAHKSGFNIVSDAIALGAVQIAGDGSPFVMMADRAPTGGYPKIATIISADIGRLAQMRPGEAFHFTRVSVAEAVAAWRCARAAMEARAIAPPELNEEYGERLFSQNLISGVISAE